MQYIVEHTFHLLYFQKCNRWKVSYAVYSRIHFTPAVFIKVQQVESQLCNCSI